MAGLNLSPNPVVMVVQGGLFLAGLYTVKSLFLAPYLQLRDRREAVTAGRKGEAEDLLHHNQKAAVELDERLVEARQSIRQATSHIHAEASENRAQIIALAEDEGKQSLAEFRHRISQEVTQARAKLPETVRQLTDPLYEKVLQ